MARSNTTTAKKAAATEAKPAAAAPNGATKNSETEAAPVAAAPSSAPAATDAAVEERLADGSARTDKQEVKPTARRVRIRSQREGFRRGGLVHSKRAVDHDPALFADEDAFAAIVNDPVLTVQFVEGDGSTFTVKSWPMSEADIAALKDFTEAADKAAV